MTEDRTEQDHFQVGKFYQKDKTKEPGGCVHVMAMMETVFYGPALVCEDENGVCAIPPEATTEGFHEVDAQTWMHNRKKVHEWREQAQKDHKSVIKTPKLIVPN